MRSVHLLHHSISPFQGQFPDGDARHYNTGIPMLFARAIRHHYPDYDVEVWRPERTLRRRYVWHDDHKVTHRVFPSRYVRYKVEFSPSLLGAVRALRADPQTYVWIHGIYNLHAHVFAHYLQDRAAIGQSHGGLPARAMFSISPHRWLRYVYFPLHLVEGLCLTKHPYLFAISTQERNYLRDLVSIPEDRLRFSPTGIDFDKFSPGDPEAARMVCGLNRDTRVLLFVGRLAEQKGLETLVEAFTQTARAFKDVDLFLVGNGPLEERLRQRVQALQSTDRIHFVGYVPQDVLPNWYRAAELTVMPSLHEWFGKVAAEAMACGTPVVATNAGGAIDIVREFECGTLVPPESVDHLADAISATLSGTVNTTPNVKRGRQAFDWGSKLSTAFDIFGTLSDART